MLSPDYICEQVYTACENTDFIKLDPQDFIKRVLSDKPDIIKNNTFVNDLYK